MSYVLTAIISMIFGAGIMARFKVSAGPGQHQARNAGRKRDSGGAV